MSGRLFDRNNYSSKTIENYEIMSAYYVDIFYNHLYIEATKMKATGNVASITEGYKHTLNAFLKGLENPKLYKKSIVGMHHYFISIGFASISFAKCVDRLTKEFIPSDYFSSLTLTQKMGVLRLVVSQSIKNFIRKLVDEHMAKIIDYHNENDNVRILQDELIDCFILEREGMYQRFIAEQTKTNKNETVNRLLAEKMQSEIKRLVKEKYEQQKQILVLKKLCLKKNVEDNKLKEYIGELKDKIKTLTEQQNTNRQFYQHHQQIQHSSNAHKPMIPNPIITSVNTSSELKEDKIQEISQPIVTSDNESDNDNDDSSLFIEVNHSNIENILHGDTEELQKLNTKMDEGTMLVDFS